MSLLNFNWICYHHILCKIFK